MCFCRAVLLRTTGDDGLLLGSDVWRAMRLWGGGDEENSYDVDFEQGYNDRNWLCNGICDIGTWFNLS